MAEVGHADVDKSAQDTTDASLSPALDRYALRSAFACFGLTYGAHRSEPQATSDDDLGEECQICMDQARGCGLTLRFPAVSYALRHQVATLTLLPCKHDGLCLNCVARVSRCPFCRARVEYVCDIDGTTSIHVPPACPLDEDRMLRRNRRRRRARRRMQVLAWNCVGMANAGAAAMLFLHDVRARAHPSPCWTATERRAGVVTAAGEHRTVPLGGGTHPARSAQPCAANTRRVGRARCARLRHARAVVCAATARIRTCPPAPPLPHAAVHPFPRHVTMPPPTRHLPHAICTQKTS